MILGVENNFFDFNDLENPIKKNLVIRYSKYINYEIYSGFNIYFRRNEYKLQDSIWPSFNNQEETGVFYSVERIEPTFGRRETASRTMFKINMYADEYTDVYSRRVLTFLEVTGTLGGLFELIEIGIGFLVGLVASGVFQTQVKIKLKGMRENFVKEMEEELEFNDSESNVSEEESEEECGEESGEESPRSNQAPKSAHQSLEDEYSKSSVSHHESCKDLDEEGGHSLTSFPKSKSYSQMIKELNNISTPKELKKAKLSKLNSKHK
eukprot:CAMPEP_0205806704 /NCGR_PEP_ID=MMETSP0205-20121125/10342_1 /ASSEMBLY_ACC=CAM_ASM_000278 /TAXON_ID=36767 /ORGANISM="Euplotes focardii, Strain TN1" /LENGTH=265 /DNA_ID=CAMNT_0053080017 /DNA_START=474 /DNA_END=1271 /DNA_ORIENTATION=-